MKKSLLLAGVLIVAATSVGGTLAASELLDHHRDHRSTEAGLSRFGETFRLAEDDHHRRDGEHRRSHHDDDEDDDEDEGGTGAARPAPTGPSDPAAPVPDNGLFQGKARPKVEVN